MEILHIIGFLLGFGGVVASCIIMLNVSTIEKQLHRGRIARRISILTWTGLILLIISGIPLTLHGSITYNFAFFAKHLCVVIIIVDALFIHFRFFPRYFRQIGSPDFKQSYKIMRNIGVLSMTCWILAIILTGLL